MHMHTCINFIYVFLSSLNYPITFLNNYSKLSSFSFKDSFDSISVPAVIVMNAILFRVHINYVIS